MLDINRDFSKLSYLALGDSYTLGEGISHSECWPVQLANSMKKVGYAIHDPKIIAKTGWSTAQLKAGIQQVNPIGPFNIVSLLIGVNNQYRGEDLSKYQQEFNSLLTIAIAFVENQPKRVFSLSIPDWGVTPFADGRDRIKISQEIDDYNSHIHHASIEAGAYYIDITDISRQVNSDPDLLASDGLHPSGKMYKLWVKRIMPTVEEILTNNKKSKHIHEI